MAVSNQTRVSSLARELGISDRELVKKAAEHGMALAIFSRLDEQQTKVIRGLFKVKTSTPEVATRTTEVGAGTVRRRRVRRPTAEMPAESAAEATPAAAVVSETAAPERGSTTVRRRPAVREDRPTLRRAKADDLEVPEELRPRVMITPKAEVTEPEAEQPAEAEVAEQAPDAQPPIEVQETVDPAEPAPAPSLEEALASLAETPEVEEVAAETEVPEVIEEGRRIIEVDVDSIGKAIDTVGPAPSTNKVPRLIRSKMPEVLVNIPKPTLRPSVVAAARADRQAEQQRAVERAAPRDNSPPPSSALAAPGRDAASTRRPERGRKLIYDRRRDGAGRFSDDRRRGRKRTKTKTVNPQPLTVPKAEKRHLKVEDTITVGNLAHQMSVKATEVIKKLFDIGIMATINHTLDLDTVELVASEFGFTVQSVAFDLESFLRQPEPELATETGRSPVVTVMGHVDHGKTTLLDRIRNARVAAREAGGITQHIGAYAVDMGAKGRIVFLDTPGHEAFTAMRARGAKATDVIVLVVAADDGVMPQTIEAINHARAADVSVIVAINKIDKPGADVERVRRELAEHKIQVEEWGGDVTACEVSAKTGEGLDGLLETLALQAEVMELTANANCDARGLVIEARLEKGRGAVATLLVQQGTLRRGDYVVAGSVYGRVRAMMDDTGADLVLAGPSTPVEIIGLSGVAVAGDDFHVTPDEKNAKAIVEHRQTKAREREAAKTSRVSLDSMFARMEEASVKELNVIVKADVHGSAEALRNSLTELEHEDVKVRVLHAAVGGVTESDIQLAHASSALIFAFNVRPEAKGKRLAEDLGVRIMPFSVIYEAIDYVLVAMEGMLEPIVEEIVHGHAEVRAVFHIAKAGQISGCYVTDGRLKRSARMRLFREEEKLWEGNVASLKRFKEDVTEVSGGYECGVGLTGFNKFKEGDRLECFDVKMTPRKLNLERSYRPPTDAE